jgi:hypothetical protein
MNCQEAARHLPGYLDGGVSAAVQARLRRHVGTCAVCRRELEHYRVLSMALANLEPVEVPPHVAVGIRIQASQRRAEPPYVTRTWDRCALVCKNILGPLAFPATGGVLAALGVFVLLLQNVLVGVPLGGFVANDEPLNLVQPAALESLGPLPMPTLDAVDNGGDASALTLDATVNAQGQAVYYKILSGPTDAHVTKQIDQVLLLSRFRPLLSFGRPTDGGHVLLSFAAIHVRG